MMDGPWSAEHRQWISESTVQVEGEHGGEHLPDKAYEADAAPRRSRPILTDAERAAIAPYPFRAYQHRDLDDIAPPDRLYGDLYVRGYVSVTLAAPKVGKSTLALAEAVDMASGRGFLTGRPGRPLTVLYYCAEDDQDTLDARVSAILRHYKIVPAEVEGRLYIHSGIEAEDFLLAGGAGADLNERLFVSIEAWCRHVGADVLILDPLQDLHACMETNETFRAVGRRLRFLGSAAGVAVGLIHHLRKPSAGGSALTIDDGRGGSALRGIARVNRLLVPMTEEEGKQAGVEDFRHYFRIGEVESNLAPPSSERNRWFYKASVQRRNGPSVGVVERWERPDAFDGVAVNDAARVWEAFKAADPAPARRANNARWGGLIVAQLLGLDPVEDVERIKQMIEAWLKSDVLAEVSGWDPVKSRDYPAIVAGPNNPAVV